MRYPFFGIAPNDYAEGKWPAIALNAGGVVVEMHDSVKNKSKKTEDGKLVARVGKADGTTLRWTGPEFITGDGFNPGVALTADNVVLQLFNTSGVDSDCWYRTGRVSGSTINWSGGEHKKYDGGRDPCVAVNRSGVVVEVHSREVAGPLFWSVGQLNGTTMKWTGHDKKKFATGFNPSVAINSSGTVVEVHDTGVSLIYRVGRVNGSKIDWLGHAEYDTGVKPSVALTDDGYVFEVHQAQALPPLFDGFTVWQRYGKVNGGRIDWIDVFGNGLSNYYDAGAVPAIASNGRQAVQTHESEVAATLHANACLVIDRASWMQDHLNQLGAKTLRGVCMPASHDAGMYLGGLSFSTFGKTQDLNIYGQLAAGVRYFDLRPQYKKDGTLVLHHGEGTLNVEGAKLADVLDQIARFMREGHRELAVLKFSHYETFTQDAFTKMCDMIQQKIGAWLYAGPPAGKRLADIPLNDYLSQRGTALVVCDHNKNTQYKPPAGAKGFFVYRDWGAEKPEEGDLIVFDIYSNTIDFDTMAFSREADPDPKYKALPRGQIPKFEGYNGKCQLKPSVACDLFLLSWTLTPPTAVWTLARIADKNMVETVGPVGVNGHGKIVNLMYVDYAEYARGADLAIIRNGLSY